MTKIYDINGNEIKPKVQVTGYKTLKELPGVPIGSLLEQKGTLWQFISPASAFSIKMNKIDDYPDFFEPITEGKKVEFMKRAEYSTIAMVKDTKPSEFAKIYYVGKKYQLDVFICYRLGADVPYIYYGHINDAIV